MSTITTLVGTDGITTANSMAKINTNFSNLNTDKMETSVLDTDTSLAANSDLKVPTQKAVKAYVDSGGANASTTVKGVVEEATAAEIVAGTAAGATGARLYVNPNTLKDSTTVPIRNLYTTVSTFLGTSTTQFTITNTSGSTYRYTYTSVGTDPGITSSNPATGAGLNIQAANFNAANIGSFVVTSSGTNFFEVTNASGVAEATKTIGGGYIAIGTKWTKPTGLKYVIVEIVGGGGGGAGAGTNNTVGGGGGGAGYTKKLVVAASLSAVEVAVIGAAGTAGTTGNNDGGSGQLSSFGSKCSASGGTGGSSPSSSSAGGDAGSGSSGDQNYYGQPGGAGTDISGGVSGEGGNSFWLGAAKAQVSETDGITAKSAGGGGSGGKRISTSNAAGGAGFRGEVVVTEYYI